MSSVVERLLRSTRQACLDHVIILRKRHLGAVLMESALRHFNTCRPHQGVGQRVLMRSGSAGTPRTNLSRVVARRVLGGLHHDYEVAA